MVSFASDVLVHLDAVSVAPENATKIRAEISSLQTRGMTNLSGGWFAGVECAARISEQDARMMPRVIILSDGHANEGIVNPEELREHAGELRMRGVLTSTLGIGDGYDELLLRGIAESGGGRLHDAELTSEISSVLLGELDDIFQTVVEDALIKLTLPAGARVKALGRGASEIRSDCILAPVGAIQNDVARVVVFKITCPKATQHDVLAFEVTVSGSAVDSRSALQPDLVHVRLVAADRAASKAQSLDVEIATIVARAWSADVVTTAARMNRDGAYEDAAKYTEEELLHFRRYVEGLDQGGEMIRELELLARRVGKQFSSRMRKEMVVQSSLAIESRSDRRGAGKTAWSARLERGD